jgi:tetratricopeptide (TPR) repeat protein
MMQRTMTTIGIALALTSLSASQSAAQSSTSAPVNAASATVQRADSLFQRKEYAAAAKVYESIVAGMPNDGRSWNRLGQARAATKDYAGAAEAFERAVAIGHNPIVIYNAAAMRARAGQRERALAWLDTLAASGFTGAPLLRGDSDFVSIQDDARFQRVVETIDRAFRPCATKPDSHRFDFWIGEWNVTTPQGQPAGRSSVQPILEQCVIFENWTDRQGGAGKSLNAYNAGLGMWQQFWTDQYGTVTEYRRSEAAEGGLRFFAETKLPKGPALLRMTFTPLDTNTVRQFGETSFDGGKTWQTGFDLYYHRVR